MKTDKSVLKQYFRSGSRPTQKQFYELIDNCYNEAFTSFVSGYHLLADIGSDLAVHSLKREGGKTSLTPYFNRINTVHRRVYHYAIPVSNVGPGLLLDKVILEMSLPQSTGYKVKDSSREVHITQDVRLESIRIFNGTEEIYNFSPENGKRDGIYDFKINKPSRQWRGISIDISITYDIKSDIAVSDQFEITANDNRMLEHIFGSSGCIFKPTE